MSRVKHLFYRLLRGKHLQRWRNFLAVPQSYLRIILYLIHHGNEATKQEIIQNLTELGGDSRSPETVERTIRYMKSDGILVEPKLGVLALKNPKRYTFIIKWIRGNPIDRWFTVSIPFAILALIFSILGEYILTQFFIIIILTLIILFIIDDYIHTQLW